MIMLKYGLSQTELSKKKHFDVVMSRLWSTESRDVVGDVTIRLPLATFLQASHSNWPPSSFGIRDIWPQSCGHTHTYTHTYRIPRQVAIRVTKAERSQTTKLKIKTD